MVIPLYQKILEADYDEDDEKVFVKTGQGMRTALKAADIDKTVSDYNMRRPKTLNQWKLFCLNIRGKVVDVSSLGGADSKSLKDKYKEEKELAKTAKFTLKGTSSKTPNEVAKDIRKFFETKMSANDPLVHKSDKLQIVEVKRDKEENDITITISMSKTLGDKPEIEGFIMELADEAFDDCSEWKKND